MEQRSFITTNNKKQNRTVELGNFGINVNAGPGETAGVHQRCTAI
jgi:hypothetical protein